MFTVHEQNRHEQRFRAEINNRVFIHPEAHVTAMAGEEQGGYGFDDGVGVHEMRFQKSWVER